MEEILAHIKLPIIHAHIIEVMCNEPVKRFIFTINYQEKPFSNVPCALSCRKGTGLGCTGNLIVKNEDINGMAHRNI